MLREHLIKVAERLAQDAAENVENGVNGQGLAQLIASSKLAIEAAMMVQSGTDTDAEVARASAEAEQVGQAYMTLRSEVLRMADGFANAGTPVAVRNAERMRQTVQEADELIPGRKEPEPRAAA